MNRKTATPAPESTPKLLTVPDAAQMLSISERSTWRLVSTGELSSVKLGRSTRITVESIDRLIERGGAE